MNAVQARQICFCCHYIPINNIKLSCNEQLHKNRTFFLTGQAGVEMRDQRPGNFSAEIAPSLWILVLDQGLFWYNQGLWSLPRVLHWGVPQLRMRKSTPEAIKPGSHALLHTQQCYSALKTLKSAWCICYSSVINWRTLGDLPQELAPGLYNFIRTRGY